MALKVIILEKFEEGGNTKLAEVKQNVFGKKNWAGSGLTPTRTSQAFSASNHDKIYEDVSHQVTSR